MSTVVDIAEMSEDVDLKKKNTSSVKDARSFPISIALMVATTAQKYIVNLNHQ